MKKKQKKSHTTKHTCPCVSCFSLYINPGPITKSILQQYDDELDNPYFRRKPTSFLAGSGGAGGGGGPAMVTGSSATLPGTGIGAGAGGDSRRCTWMPMDDDAVRIEGPRLYRCPAHSDLPPAPPPPPPPNIGLIDGIAGGPPRAVLEVNRNIMQTNLESPSQRLGTVKLQL
ncbi:hypothetical protein quinque_011504 [Culex quinquefasciatus]